MPTNPLDNLLNELSSSEWENRQQAAQGLAILGETAKDALPALRTRMAVEDDWDVQLSIVQAISKVETDKPTLIRDMLGYLGHPNRGVRDLAVEELGDLGPAAKEALNVLWMKLLLAEGETNLNSFARAIARIDADTTSLLSKCLNDIRDGDKQKIQAATIVLGYLPLTDADQTKAADILWEVITGNHDVNVVTQAFKTLAKLTTKDKVAILNKLIDDPRISTPMKNSLLLLPDVASSLNELWKTRTSAVLQLILAEMDREDAWTQPEVQFLTEKASEIPRADLAAVLSALRKVFKKQGLGFAAIKKMDPSASDEVLNDPETPLPIVGQTLLTEPEANLEERWNTDRDRVLSAVLAAIENPGSRDIRDKGVSWLASKVAEIPPASFDAVMDRIAKMQNDSDAEDFASLNAAVIQFRQKQKEVKTSPLLNVIRAKESNEDAKIEVIGKLVGAGGRDSIRALVNEWVQWIAWDEKALVEFAAESMRQSPDAIRPLVDQLNQQWRPDSSILPKIFFNNLPYDLRDLLFGVYEGNDLVGDRAISRLREWINSVGLTSEKILDLKRQAEASKCSRERLAKEIIDVLILDELKVRRVKVHDRVCKQLADMSDPRFEEEQTLDTCKKIKQELKRHALPVLGRRLSTEENVEIRESMAQALGYIGGREAIEALSRAVAGEERIRTARQELLAKYYLEPSKARSEEAANILKEAADEAKRTLRLQHRLNVAVFAVGLLILTAGVLTSMFSQQAGTRIVGALAGIGGLAGLITQMIKAPIDRVQHAMANLVQIETAFTSFIWELNLNGTYIQSQYVAQGVLTDNEIAQTVRRIEEAMNLAMNLVAVYTQDRGQRIVTRINNLVPAAGGTGAEVTISGQHLLGDRGDKKDGAGIVAIDHAPINAADVSWNNQEVKFKLPQTLPNLNEHDQTVWISLFVDGMETNALPFHVVRQ